MAGPNDPLNDSKPVNGKGLDSTALNTLSQLVGLQLFSKAFTFILNQILVRIASPEVFGTATIQFELLLSTILFLSREGVRTALLRAGPSDVISGEKNSKKEIKGGEYLEEKNLATELFSNTSTLPILIGLPLSLFTTLLYTTYLSTLSTRSQPHFHTAISLYALSALTELLSEPLYLRAISELKVHTRVRAEGAAVVTKAVGTVVLLWLMGAEWSLVAFAGGQMVYALAVLGVFVTEYGWKNLRVVPKLLRTSVHGK